MPIVLNGLIGKAVDAREKLAGPILTLMVHPIMGLPSFVALSVPVYANNAQLQKHILMTMTAVEPSATVIGMITNNHSINLNCYTLPGAHHNEP